MFNNYAEGAPSLRLYVKNLAKQTTEQDLRFIFSAFLEQDPEEASNSMCVLFFLLSKTQLFFFQV